MRPSTGLRSRRGLTLVVAAVIAGGGFAGYPAHAEPTAPASPAAPAPEEMEGTGDMPSGAAPADENAAPMQVRGPGQTPGAVYANRELARERMLGGSQGNDFTYWSTGADGKAHLSSGLLMLPKGSPPRGGWPVVAWAHGSRGIADGCAPSARPVKADTDEMRRWLQRGYAVVSADYVGVGTPGTPQYFDIETTAGNIVDAVKAARDISDVLSRKWVVVGEAQGASAAIALARSAAADQGERLDFRGAAATSIPAEFGSLLANLGPTSGAMPGGLAVDALYTLSAIRNARPALDVDAYLTDTGKQWLTKAATLCTAELSTQVDGLVFGSLLSKPLQTNAGLTKLLTEATALPVRGFERPLLMTQALQDTSVVVPLSLKYLNEARTADRRVDARTYLTIDGNAAQRMSDNDIRMFVERMLR